MNHSWISGSGDLLVERTSGGELRARGRLRTPPDSVMLEGSVQIVDENRFTLTGLIHTTRYGRECPRRGTFTFLISEGRRFWRLQETSNSCASMTDYLDIYY